MPILKLFAKILFVIILPLLLLPGCIENVIQQKTPVELENSARLLDFIEAQGDFANTPEAPGLITASDLYTALDQFTILDVRPADEFTAGHIATAVNISNHNLAHVVDSIYTVNSTKKIVLVCKNGQPSAYYTCLLRLLGYRTVYCLKYGMASWNSVFADEWFHGQKDHQNISSFTNDIFDKGPFEPLPPFEPGDPKLSFEENCKQRIRQVVLAGFMENQNYIKEVEVQTEDIQYIVCLGPKALYLGGKLLPDGLFSHIPYTRWYQPFPLYELRSTNYLQTLPSSREIILYTTNGLLGASVCAQLTVLGYDVKTILFGGNQLFHTRMSATAPLVPDVFSNSDIMNFPYTTGSGKK